MFTIVAPQNSTVFVEFGVDTKNGFVTSPQPAPQAGGAVSVLVAGMRADTLYHMRGIIEMSDGSRFADGDLSFITGSLPAAQLPKLSVTTSADRKPQAGIELVNSLSPNTPVPIFATDLSGNVIWSYQFQGSFADTIQPIKLLPNGHFIVVITPGSTSPTAAVAPPADTIDVIREIDLAGTTIREISIGDLNTKLAAAGYDLTLGSFHHDVLALPNGHWIALSNTVKQFTDVTGFPGVFPVLGDVIVDLDENLNPVWVWNAFDHMDVNRHPLLFPDWTHANALVYSDDGNLLISMRHQNWIIKVDYANGVGTGNILWHLGQQGDFALKGGVDPTDWFYAQHAPSFTTTNTSGKFSLVLFDNGDDRAFAPGQPCQSTGDPACLFSTVPILDIDEAAKTATLAFHYKTPEYSNFGGNADVLPNGNVEFDECDSTDFINPAADIYEVTQGSNPEIIWHMHVAAEFAYRAFRLPSLYPGVQ